MNDIVSYLARIIFHIVIILGVWWLIQPSIENIVINLNQKNDLKRNAKERLEKYTSRKNKGNVISRHIDNLLYLVQHNYEQRVSVIRFYIQCVFLFSAVFIVASLTMNELPNHLTFENPFMGGIQIDNKGASITNWKFPFFIAILFAILPYLKLRYTFAQRSVKASYDLKDIVQIFARHTYLSVDQALNKTAELLDENNVLKRPLQILSDVFANYSNEIELNKEVNRFAALIKTTFARILTSDLLYAEREGTSSLSSSLMELNSAMEQQRETIIDVKAENSEAITLGFYGNLVVLVSIISTFMYMLTPVVYFKLQFQTKVGLVFMGVIIGSLFIAFAISLILSKPKLDY